MPKAAETVNAGSAEPDFLSQALYADRERRQLGARKDDEDRPASPPGPEICP